MIWFDLFYTWQQHIKCALFTHNEVNDYNFILSKTFLHMTLLKIS